MYLRVLSGIKIPKSVKQMFLEKEFSAIQEAMLTNQFSH